MCFLFKNQTGFSPMSRAAIYACLLFSLPSFCLKLKTDSIWFEHIANGRSIFRCLATWVCIATIRKMKEKEIFINSHDKQKSQWTDEHKHYNASTKWNVKRLNCLIIFFFFTSNDCIARIEFLSILCVLFLSKTIEYRLVSVSLPCTLLNIFTMHKNLRRKICVHILFDDKFCFTRFFHLSLAFNK